MTRDEIKKALSAYLKAKRDLSAAKRAAAKLRADAGSLQSPLMLGIPHGGSAGDPVSAAACRLMDSAERVSMRAEACADVINGVLRLISLVRSDDGRAILLERFIVGTDFDNIPDQLHISTRTMWRRYREALDDIEQATSENVGSDWQ